MLYHLTVFHDVFNSGVRIKHVQSALHLLAFVAIQVDASELQKLSFQILIILVIQLFIPPVFICRSGT